MTASRKHVIRQGIAGLARELRRLNAEQDRLLRRIAHCQKARDWAEAVRASERAHVLCRAVRGLEYRMAAARELLIYDVERRFQFRRRLHVRENGGRKRYHFWKI